MKLILPICILIFYSSTMGSTQHPPTSSETAFITAFKGVAPTDFDGPIKPSIVCKKLGTGDRNHDCEAYPPATVNVVMPNNMPKEITARYCQCGARGFYYLYHKNKNEYFFFRGLQDKLNFNVKVHGPVPL